MGNNMSFNILIVEDEPRLAGLIKDYVLQAGMTPHSIENGLDVVPWVEQRNPDLVLLDLMLPGKDGLTICQERRRTSNVPRIMVTARIEEIDRLLALELGADDYICKPFSPREVIARVKAVLRRNSPEQKNIAKGLRLDYETYKATLNGKVLDLTAVEFNLLAMLAKKPGRIYSRDQVMDIIYSDQRVVSDRTIDSHVKKLRKKIALILPGQEIIQSVYGVGYKFDILDDQ